MKLSSILSKRHQADITNAIYQVEELTSGEIRLHIENYCNSSPKGRASEVFSDLEMHATEERNGILIYIAHKDKKVAIIGDKGIDAHIPQEFWEQEVNLLIEQFKQGNFSNAIVKTILVIGERMNVFFPPNENDLDQLPNDISFYDN